MKRLIFFLILSSMVSPLFAYRDRLAKITRAELTFEGGDRVLLTQDRTRLLSLVLQTTDAVLEIPGAELEGISLPRIESMAVLWGSYENGVKYKYIRFSYGLESERAFGELPSIDFLFKAGKYDGRQITRKVSDSGWDIEGPSGGGTASKAQKK